VKVRAYVDGFDVSNAILVESLTIEQDSTQAISTCNAAFIQKYGEARYDRSTYDHAAFRYTWNAQEWAEFVVSDQDTNQLLFAGYIMSVQRRQEGPHVRIEMLASDWGILFERTVMTQAWPAGTLDSTIVEDCLAQVPLLSAGTIVPQVENIGEFSVKDQRVRDVLDQVCQLTGGEWNVGYNGKLNYYRQGSILAPFDLSDQAGTAGAVQYQLEDYQTDFSRAANKVLVLGAIGDFGEVRETAEDGSSQLRYGVLSITLVDRDIFDPAQAQLFAQSEVTQRAWPQITVRVSVYVPGLTRGMTVNIESVKYGQSATLILRSLTITIAAPDRTRAAGPGHILKYTATLGPRPPDLVYTLRRMQRDQPESTFAPTANVPPGSITAGDLASDLEIVHVVDVLPVPPPADYSPTAFAVVRSDPFHKLYRRTGNTWTLVVDAESIQGQLQTSQLAPGSVTSTVLADGSVVTAKIPAGAIQAPQLAASSVTANAVAANAIYAQALQANSVTAVALAANSVVAGKLAALAVTAGTIAGDAVTAGTIAAGAVRAGNLAAGAVTAGTIAAGAIVVGNIGPGAVTEGTLAAQAVTANAIRAGTITSDKLNAIELAIGFGGDKPGVVTVYESGTNKVAMLGYLGAAGLGAYGLWAKVGAFGGTGYFDARVYTDTAGNLFIKQANFTILAGDGSKVETSPTTFDPTYGSIALNVSKQGEASTALVSRGLVIRDTSGTVIGGFVRHPSVTNVTQLAMTVPGGKAIILDGQTGLCRADGGFGVSGAAGKSGSFRDQAGNLITVTGGLITGGI